MSHAKLIAHESQPIIWVLQSHQPPSGTKGAKDLTNVGLSDEDFGTRCESRTSSHEIVLVATGLVKA